MNKSTIPNYENLAPLTGYQSYIKDMGPAVLDRYALTMTRAVWELGMTDRISTSNVFCRSFLNNGQHYKDSGSDEIKFVKIPYFVSAGLGLVAEWFDGWKWGDRELGYLAQQKIDNGKGNKVRTFPDEFLFWLSNQRLTLDIKAIPEGQIVMPFEPIMQMTGPWWQQMCVEAMTLQLISSSTNLATVATQVRLASQRMAHAEGATLIDASAKDVGGLMEKATLSEMALRRSPSIGAIQSARAAAIAGWDATSNDYAGMCYGIPAMGTFAHAWIMLHDTEEAAFENWAKVYARVSAVFLVDTYSTLDGVKTAIRVCKKYNLRLKGLRFDSGNMGYLSVQAYKLVAEAGYKDAKVLIDNQADLFDAAKVAYLASDSVTVNAAASLFARASDEVGERNSRINSFGIGSTVAVNRDNPLLDFVMKLCALHDKEGLREVLKLSETEKKTTLPGMIDVIRYIDTNGRWAGDTIIPENLDIGEGRLARDVYSENAATGEVRVFPKGAPFIRVLVPWMKDGKMLQKPYMDRDPAKILALAREECRASMAKLDPAHLALPPDMPHWYGTGIAEELASKRTAAVKRIHGNRSLEKQRERFGLE